MTRNLRILILLACLLPLSALAQVQFERLPMEKKTAAVVPIPDVIEKPILTGRMIIKLSEPNSARIMAQVERVLSVKVIGPVGKGPYLLVRPTSNKGFVALAETNLPIEWIEAESRMALLPIVERREIAPLPVPKLPKALDARAVPNDPYWRYQWGMQDGLYGVGLPTARALSQGKGVIVAVLDTGVRQSLTDLAGTKFMSGLNTITGTTNTIDDNGHGTHVTGTIAQTTDNFMGCAGLASAATILPVKVLNKAGQGTNYTIAAGIRYAVDKGARVLNMSIGGAGSQTIRDAIDYAHNRGVVLCAAAGNSGRRGLTFPAGYPHTIAIGAATGNGRRASYSQWGPGLTLVAPGAQILQQTFGQSTGKSGYFYLSGTSMATPHVTAACALVLSINPKLSADAVRALLQETARDLGVSGPDETFGSGLLNAGAACQKALTDAPPGMPPVPVPTPTPTPVPEPTPVPTPTPPPTPTPVPTPVPDPVPGDSISQVLALHNQERAKVGLPALLVHTALRQAARLHAVDMEGREEMSHYGADGSDPGVRITRQGYVWRTYGENIAAGQTTAEQVMRAWMSSPGHKDNILRASFKEIGIGRSGNYWTVNFGAR